MTEAIVRLDGLLRGALPNCDGASIGRWHMRETWRATWSVQPSPAEEAIAQAILDAFDPGALPVEEDPGEQPEIFDEEDVAAAGEAGAESEHVAVQEEAQAGPVSDQSADGDGASAGGGEADGAYPGIAILPDTLGARRNAVLAAITTEKLTRLAIAMDPSRADFLAARFADYNNAGALGLPIDDALAADYRAFQELRDRRDRLTNYAMQLEQSALDGDMDRLEAMHAGLGEGWPT